MLRVSEKLIDNSENVNKSRVYSNVDIVRSNSEGVLALLKNVNSWEAGALALFLIVGVNTSSVIVWIGRLPTICVAEKFIVRLPIVFF